MKMKKVITAFILVGLSGVACAVTPSPKGKITGYYTGWATDEIRVTIEGAAYTENNCPHRDGYSSRESDNSGYKTHTTALLAAFVSGKPVTIIVDGCINGRPRIFGVNID
jgi:hypothetical protein